MPDRLRILVLDGHSNPGLACVRSLGRAGHTVLVASPHRQPLGAWSRYCRGRVRYAGPTRTAFAELREWAIRQGAELVLPVSEESCALLNLERDAWESADMIVGCGPQEMLLEAFDKGRTIRAAQACGLRIPPTHFPESLEESLAAGVELGYPCVVKPRFSQIWDGEGFRPGPAVRLVATSAALEAAVLESARTGAWPLVQAVVPGRGTGVFALFDQGRPLAWFAQESLRAVKPMASPNCLRRPIPLAPRLREQADRLLSHFAWHGPAMVELRDNGREEPWFMEVNGRFWFSLQLAVSAGVDFPSLWVAALQGRPAPGPATYREDVVLRWLWGDVKRFLGTVLRKPPVGYSGPYPTVGQGLRELFGRQPDGTCMEIWQRDDPWPAVGEGIQALRQATGFLKRHRPGHQAQQPGSAPPVKA